MNSVEFEDLPELTAIANRELRLQELEQQIRDEQDTNRKELMYDTYIALSKLNYGKLMEYSTHEIIECVEKIKKSTELTATFERQCQQLVDKLTEEREEHERFYEYFCFCMIEDPKYTFESVLKQLERSEKIKDQSGKAWEWTLRFHLMARIRMAFRLIFGTKNGVGGINYYGN